VCAMPRTELAQRVRKSAPGLPAPRRVTPELLTKWREEHHWTPAELADKLGVSTMTIRRWEAGAVRLPPYLGLSLNWLHARVMDQMTSF
jgi:DNA-binding XRE family transcriptional regulator